MNVIIYLVKQSNQYNMDIESNFKISTNCYHCGDQVEDSAYVFDNHNFCCLGCQTVYQVLNQNNLNSYYKYNSHPGKSQKIQKEMSLI